MTRTAQLALLIGVTMVGMSLMSCAVVTSVPTVVREEPVPAHVTRTAEAAAVQAIETALAATATPRSQEQVLKGTVSLWHSWMENEIESLNEVIAAFQKKHPGVQFDVLYVPLDDLHGEYETATAAGRGPTVLIGVADWGPALFDAELIADVRGFTSAPFLASINEAALGAVEYEGALIGLPQTVKGVVMYRNTSIIPEAPATFEDLVVAAKAATAGDTVGANLEYGFFFAAAHLNGIGGQLMDKNGDPLFNDQKGVEWLSLLNSFKDAGPTEYYTDNDVNLFKAGKVGIIIDGTWNMAGLAKAIGVENVAIDPWSAYGEGHLSGYVLAESIYLSANAKGYDQLAAWAFMEFFLLPEAQAILADPTKAGHIPVVTDAEVTDPLMAQAVDAFAGGMAFPVIPEMDAYWLPMDAALESVFDEGANPTQALRKAHDEIIDRIAEIRGG